MKQKARARCNSDLSGKRTKQEHKLLLAELIREENEDEDSDELITGHISRKSQRIYEKKSKKVQRLFHQAVS